MLRSLLTGVFLFAFLLSAAALAGTPLPGEEPAQRTERFDGPTRARLAQLRKLEQARQAGDVIEATRLQQLLFPEPSIPTAPADPAVVQVPDGPLPSPRLWADDVMIRSGSNGGNSQRGLCIDNDAAGNVYAGIIMRGSTADTFYVYRSTTMGATWSYVSGFYVSGRKLQSCAMHVTDTTGTSFIGILGAFVMPLRQDGGLVWVGFRENGSGWRANTFRSASGGYGYNNVSLVSDGYDYAPGLTWWFGAAARVDSLGEQGEIIAFRSTTWGASWPVIDTVRAGFDDRYPTIDYEDVSASAGYHSTTQRAIHDTTTITSTLSVPGPIRIGALHVRIDSIIHSWDADLDVYLFTPWGDSVELFTDVGSSGDNFIGTVLTDSASTLISSGSAPFTGAFRPEATNMPDSSFASWTGRSAQGTWVLRIRDDATSDTGRLYGWSLFIDPYLSEQVHIAGEFRSGSSTYLRLFQNDASFDGTGEWAIQYLSSGSATRGYSDLAANWSTGDLGLVYAENNGSNYDLKGFESTDGGETWSDAVDVAATARNELFPSLDNAPNYGGWRLAYNDQDSVMYRSSSTFGGLASASSTYIGDHAPTTSFRPEVGVVGTGFFATGCIVYAGFGPQNVYYDAFYNQEQSFNYSASWNLLSNPFFEQNDSIGVLFPTATYPYGFAYDSATGYAQNYRMEPGRGYWMKFPSAVSQSLSGMTIISDTVSVKTGWNMFGPPSSLFDTSWVDIVPSGNRASLYFGYAGGYSSVQMLQPGQGYWVKMSGPGFIIFPQAIVRRSPERGKDPLDGLGRLEISDASGAGQTLYLGSGDASAFPRSFYMLPPQGPEGTFDVRYSSGSMAEVYGEDGGSFAVDLSGTRSPLTVSWTPGADGRSVTVSDGTGRARTLDGGRVSLDGLTARRLTVATGSGSVPREFALLPNYPNPFNPATLIRYALPVRARVTLKIFNVIGQEVATLVNDELPAGMHEVTFDGSALGSGVYFCSIKAGSFSATRKMMLLK
jgi:subtilisin-like proprotein convertase family protein